MFFKIYSTVVRRVSVVLNLMMKEQIMKDQIVQFLRDEEGATAIEYGLIAGVIAVGILISLQGVREAIITLFDDIKTKLGTAATAK